MQHFKSQTKLAQGFKIKFKQSLLFKENKLMRCISGKLSTELHSIGPSGRQPNVCRPLSNNHQMKKDADTPLTTDSITKPVQTQLRLRKALSSDQFGPRKQKFHKIIQRLQNNNQRTKRERSQVFRRKNQHFKSLKTPKKPKLLKDPFLQFRRGNLNDSQDQVRQLLNLIDQPMNLKEIDIQLTQTVPFKPLCKEITFQTSTPQEQLQLKLFSPEGKPISYDKSQIRVKTGTTVKVRLSDIAVLGAATVFCRDTKQFVQKKGRLTIDGKIIYNGTISPTFQNFFFVEGQQIMDKLQLFARQSVSLFNNRSNRIQSDMDIRGGRMFTLKANRLKIQIKGHDRRLVIKSLNFVNCFGNQIPLQKVIGQEKLLASLYNKAQLVVESDSIQFEIEYQKKFSQAIRIVMSSRTEDIHYSPKLMIIQENKQPPKLFTLKPAQISPIQTVPVYGTLRASATGVTYSVRLVLRASQLATYFKVGRCEIRDKENLVLEPALLLVDGMEQKGEVSGSLPQDILFCFEEKVSPEYLVVLGVDSDCDLLTFSLYFDELIVGSGRLQTKVKSGQKIFPKSNKLPSKSNFPGIIFDND